MFSTCLYLQLPILIVPAYSNDLTSKTRTNTNLISVKQAEVNYEWEVRTLVRRLLLHREFNFEDSFGRCDMSIRSRYKVKQYLFSYASRSLLISVGYLIMSLNIILQWQEDIFWYFFFARPIMHIFGYELHLMIKIGQATCCGCFCSSIDISILIRVPAPPIFVSGLWNNRTSIPARCHLPGIQERMAKENDPDLRLPSFHTHRRIMFHVYSIKL